MFKAIKGFENLIPVNCYVRRNNKKLLINVYELVIGDIIEIKNGSRVPADVRILHSNQLKIEASSITGEAEPIEYNYHKVDNNVDIFNAYNIAFNGSLCVNGEGLGLVIFFNIFRFI